MLARELHLKLMRSKRFRLTFTVNVNLYQENKFYLNLYFSVRDRSLFITWGGSEDFAGDHLIFRRTEGGISRN